LIAGRASERHRTRPEVFLGQIPSTWLSGPGPRRLAQRVLGRTVLGRTIEFAASQKRQHLRAQAGESAGHAGGFALHAVRHGIAGNAARGPMPQVRIRVALLQAVHVFRSRKPLRVHAASDGANRQEGRAQRLPVVRNPRDARERNLNAGQPASQQRPAGIRQLVQEVGTAIACAGSDSFSNWQLAVPYRRSREPLWLSLPVRTSSTPDALITPFSTTMGPLRRFHRGRLLRS
jgi:hypothetical protein